MFNNKNLFILIIFRLYIQIIQNKLTKLIMILKLIYQKIYCSNLPGPRGL